MEASTYRKIEISLKAYMVSVGDVRIYKRVLKHAPDVSTADEFMLSKKGGYTESELNRIKYLIEYEKKAYQNKLKLKLSI
ncbi:co-chaperonin GroES (HSP10) [Acholeplasma morum]|uniref:hypothetical protein n=1 Tax=Paracholeplasma morum TaxID=264637 RepID=UPI001958E050|nr:hypothetical protein [Paracholeplasma morum]MBM7454157.1 co-chaperonin GroES (HSP10) [Paracholeplasma morum]